jgi:hypothetical protein
MTWENLNERNTTSELSVVAIDHRIDLFVRGSDGSLRWTMGDDRGFRPWQRIGGTFAGAPHAVGWNLSQPFRGSTFVGSGGLDSHYVFVRKLDGSLGYKTLTSNIWTPAGDDYHSLGGVISSDPSVASFQPHQIDIVARGTDGAVWHNSIAHTGEFRQTIGGWQSLGGSTPEPPVIVAAGEGNLHVFTVGTNYAVWHRSIEGIWLDDPLRGTAEWVLNLSHWTPWRQIGGGGNPVNSVVSPLRPVFVAGAVSRGLDPWTYVFWTGKDMLMRHVRIAPQGGLSVVETRGIRTPFLEDRETLCPVSWGPGRLDVFQRSPAKSLSHSSFQEVRGFAPEFWPWDGPDTSCFSEPIAVAGSPNRLDVFTRYSEGVFHKFWDGRAWRP